MSSLLLLGSVVSLAQCPTSPILLTTQEEIDNFATNYPNCYVLTHELKIDGDNSNITNLNGLSVITNTQNFYILKTGITDFSGLEHLISTSHLSIGFNPNIQNLSGLSTLQSVEEFTIWFNPGLTSVDGLPVLQSIDRLNIFQNYTLNDITAFNTIESLQSLSIGGNGMTSLVGFENLHSVEEDVFISNENLQDFNPLSNLSTINGSLYIWNHSQLQDLTAFSSITSVVDLFVVGCTNLTNLAGLENIQTVSGRLRIGYNPGLTDLSVLNNITYVEDLDIYENEQLTSLSGLENLLEIQQTLYILDNPILTDISALNNVTPFEVDQVVIQRNTNLAMCNNDFICGILELPAVEKVFENNAPGCNSIPEIEAACILSVPDEILQGAISIYPNPVSEILFISDSVTISFENASLYSLLGQHLMETSEKEIDMSHLRDGIYFITITTSHGNINKKLIKR
ncbi:MAG: T9SS type A sorting domain-containing protein [Altibacter sp.]|uniref:T9SS type A sorting domain-containing protein n=1 Tax=Altibacter sp. TaxID=2024823 RepID=UPI001D5573BB|nr:T9SS type A sorting domain-containing protein [Altibacter sp.]MBZ0328641.1 T9SS type A sorting domain-containing protein [Altibacter sp.]